MEIKLLVMDVDGTLTDGKIYMSADGEIMKAFNIKDGYAIAHLREYGIEPVIITGRESEIVKKRCEELGIKELHQGISNKLFCLRTICNKKGIGLNNVAYIGDDVNDIPCIRNCGFSACPSDAVSCLSRIVDYVCDLKGGEGAVRELIEQLLQSNNDSLEFRDGNYDFQEVKYEIDPNIND